MNPNVFASKINRLTASATVRNFIALKITTQEDVYIIKYEQTRVKTPLVQGIKYVIEYLCCKRVRIIN